MTTTDLQAPKVYTAKDFSSDQEVRWCPGCGDYSILKQVQTVLPRLGYHPHEIVFVSGIGCSSRFPYYMDTYGIHSIHGRATAVATGLKMTRPDLSVWVITGDGDALSIGGNHTIHLIRRNVNVNVLLFNNQIYGLTKGQYSPTSEVGKVTKSTPMGSADEPFNPLALVLGANATFVARSLDRDPKHLQEMIQRADAHKGTSFLEIYQNCNVFNDGAFEAFTEKNTKDHTTLRLEHGKPLLFADGTKGIKLDGFVPIIVDTDTTPAHELWIHDENDYIKATILSRFFDMPDPEHPTHYHTLPRPVGVIYQNNRVCYEEAVNEQIRLAKQQKGTPNLNALIQGNETWQVTNPN
jgi:2-oxoglutarate ferredoxin oxidoreductase subunit beta